MRPFHKQRDFALKAALKGYFAAQDARMTSFVESSDGSVICKFPDGYGKYKLKKVLFGKASVDQILTLCQAKS